MLLQEYVYWVIYNSWDLRETYGPMEAEFSITNSADMKAELPQSHELFERTIPKIMAPPPPFVLEEFIQQ